MKTKKLIIAVFAAIVCFGGTVSADIVTNGGFETGDFTGWTLGGNTDFVLTTEDPSFVYAGLWAAAFGEVGSPGTLSQELPTVAGSSYVLSFWLYGDGSVPNEFAVSVGSTDLFDATNLDLSGYTPFTFDFQATGPGTMLTFTTENANDYFFLDNISVNSVPEPASLQLLAMSAAAGLLASHKKRVASIITRLRPAVLQFVTFSKQTYSAISSLGTFDNRHCGSGGAGLEK
jgi:Protein of unknown function (DUF642)